MSKSLVTRILRGTPRNLRLLARRLREGELVAVPTETVYGLAANALDATACTGIFRAKGRPQNDPLIVHLHSAREMDGVCVPNAAALKLAAAFWPGPMTLVLPKKPVIPDVVTAGRNTVAVRVPSHPLFRKLLKLAARPLAAPSANPFGYVSPTTAEHVRDGLRSRIRYILQGGPTSIGVESTIVDVRDEAHPRLLRPGAITRAQLEAVLGCEVAEARPAARKKTRAAQLAPGMLSRHYSPRTPVRLHEELTRGGAKNEAYVFFKRHARLQGRNVFWLSETGDVGEAARRLFSVLRKLDHAGYARLNVELAPGSGLADAINDRLRRAAAR